MKTATTLLNETFERLQLGDAAGIPISRLEYDESRRMIVLEIDGKGVALIPLENVCGMVPLGKGEEKDFQITTAEAKQKIAIERAMEAEKQRKAAEQAKVEAARQRALDVQKSAARQVDAQAEAERIRAEYKRNHPDESTPFPANYEPPPPVATRLGMRLGETPEEPEAAEKPKPKKRKGRPKGSKNKPKEATS